jgi:uncharacterized protein
MNIVIDTNVLLVSTSERAKSRWLFDMFLEEKFTLCVTNEILNEYAEIFTQHWGKDAADEILELIEASENVQFVNTYYRWNLIQQDPDDNKFVDCAIACNAKYLISEDKHFEILKTIAFPIVEVLKVHEFKALFMSRK